MGILGLWLVVAVTDLQPAFPFNLGYVQGGDLHPGLLQHTP